MSSNLDGLLLLAVLGLVCGLLAGSIIIAFRLFMEGAASQILPGGNIEGFEDMPPRARFLLCVAGGLLVGLILHCLKPKTRVFGIVHVIERLEYHQGKLPWKNAAIQFLVASISVVSGQSVGREGPSVHLGATSGSLLGRVLQVPNNSVRILVGSGVAAAIAAAFNTPLAGVIFAMEVVIMEYTVVGFAPVIIAAVSATSLAHLTFGDATAFSVPDFEVSLVHEIPFAALMGAVVGCVSAFFIQLTLLTSSLFISSPIWIRTMLAGILTGTIAFAVPQVMGTGYDTLNHMLFAQIGLAGVLILTLSKVIATSAAIGLGIPAGIIGPTLFIGAAAGAAFGWVGAALFPDLANPGFYAMLGMAAMMAATLQAPLAALISLLELTANQSVILPGMIAVVTAALITRVVFGKSSIYRHLMLTRNLDYRNSPMSIALRRTGVANIMERNFAQPSTKLTLEQAEELLQDDARWILLSKSGELRHSSILPAPDLARFLSEISSKNKQSTTDKEQEATGEDSEPQLIDLLKIPAKRQDISPITIISTLQEALEKMRADDCSMLYVTGAHGASKNRIYGIVTRDHIEQSYSL